MIAQGAVNDSGSNAAFRLFVGKCCTHRGKYCRIDFIESYGSDYTIDVSFGRETKLKESEYDLSEYKSFYGSAPNVSEAYEIVTNVTFKGSKGSEDAKLYIYVGKCSGKWCIFNITQDNGIVDEDTGLKTSEN